MVDKLNSIQRPPESYPDFNIHVPNIIELQGPEPDFDSIEEIDEYSGELFENIAPVRSNKSIRPSSAKVVGMRPRYFKEPSPKNKESVFEKLYNANSTAPGYIHNPSSNPSTDRLNKLPLEFHQVFTKSLEDLTSSTIRNTEDPSISVSPNDWKRLFDNRPKSAYQRFSFNSLTIGSKHPNPIESSRSTNRPSSAYSTISARNAQKVSIGITRNISKKNLEPAITINAFPLYDALVRLHSDRQQFIKSTDNKNSFELSDREIHKINRTKSIENILRLNAKKNPQSASFKVLRIAKKEKEKMYPNRSKPIIAKVQSEKFRVPMIDSSSEEETSDRGMLNHTYKISGIEDVDSYIRNIDILKEKPLESLRQVHSDEKRGPLTRRLSKRQVDITMPNSPFINKRYSDHNNQAVTLSNIEDILQVRKINPHKDTDRSSAHELSDKTLKSSRRNIVVHTKIKQSEDNIPTLESESSDNSTFRLENLNIQPRNNPSSIVQDLSNPSEGLINLVNIKYDQNQGLSSKLPNSIPFQPDVIHSQLPARPKTAQNFHKSISTRPKSASNLQQSSKSTKSKVVTCSASSFSSFTSPFGQPIRGKKVGTTFQFGIMFRPVPVSHSIVPVSKESNLAVMSTTSLKRARWDSAKNRFN